MEHAANLVTLQQTFLKLGQYCLNKDVFTIVERVEYWKLIKFETPKA